MAKPPTLIRDAEEQWKIRGSFPNGRYRFSLRPGAVSLLTSDLGYAENDTVPWRLFRILVFTGDAWLPNQSTGRVQTGNGLFPARRGRRPPGTRRARPRRPPL